MIKIGIFDPPIFPGTEFHDELGGYDSGLWLQLFVEADKISPDLSQRLMYLRNTGCRLSKSDKFNYIIQPIEDYWDQAGVNYNTEKQCLNKYRAEIVNLLRGLK